MKRFEGLRRKAAQLPDGGWTIGYGHSRSAREGAVVTPEEAEALLIWDLRKVAEVVSTNIYTPLNQNQFDALVAFAFNIGTEEFARSAVMKRLNEGNYLQAAAAFELWRKAEFGGEELVVDALVRRRAAEKALFLTPPEGFRPIPTPVIRVKLDPSILETLETRRAALASPVLGDVSLDGPFAAFEREEDAPFELTPDEEPVPTAEADDDEASPALAAAANVKARLERLLSEDEESESEAPDVAPPPAPEPSLFEGAALQSDDVQPTRVEPTADDVGDTGVLRITAEPAAELPPEPETPSLFDPLAGLVRASDQPAPPPEPEPAAAPEANGAFGRRSRPVEYTAYPRSTPTPRRNRAAYGAPMLILALVGAAMFVGSIVAMLSGKATFPNLCIGLVGVICLAPAGIRFLLNRIEQRPEFAPTE